MKLYWNFQRCGEVLEKIPSVGEVWIFSGTTHYIIKQVLACINLMLVITLFTKSKALLGHSREKAYKLAVREYLSLITTSTYPDLVRSA